MQNSYYYFCFKVNGCSATTWINGKLKLKLLHLFESVTASFDRYVAAVVVADVVVVVDVVDFALLSTRQTSTS